MSRDIHFPHRIKLISSFFFNGGGAKKRHCVFKTSRNDPVCVNNVCSWIVKVLLIVPNTTNIPNNNNLN